MVPAAGPATTEADAVAALESARDPRCRDAAGHPGPRARARPRRARAGGLAVDVADVDHRRPVARGELGAPRLAAAGGGDHRGRVVAGAPCARRLPGAPVASPPCCSRPTPTPRWCSAWCRRPSRPPVVSTSCSSICWTGSRRRCTGATSPTFRPPTGTDRGGQPGRAPPRGPPDGRARVRGTPAERAGRAPGRAVRARTRRLLHAVPRRPAPRPRSFRVDVPRPAAPQLVRGGDDQGVAARSLARAHPLEARVHRCRLRPRHRRQVARVRATVPTAAGARRWPTSTTATGFPFPGERFGIYELGARHDWVHVLAATRPPEGELDVFAFIAASMTDERPRAPRHHPRPVPERQHPACRGQAHRERGPTP